MGFLKLLRGLVSGRNGCDGSHPIDPNDGQTTCRDVSELESSDLVEPQSPGVDPHFAHNSSSTSNPRAMSSVQRKERPNSNPSVLGEQQMMAFKRALDGENMFLTGAGGTGKSRTLRLIIDAFRREGGNVVVCAPTGTAAIAIGGVTIHRAFRLKRGPQLIDGTIDVSPIVRAADAIIIDEISMVRRDVFDVIMEMVLSENKRRFRSSERRQPIQLVTSGDFSQLPPVISNNTEIDVLRKYYAVGDLQGCYAFQSSGWARAEMGPCILSDVYRQADKSLVDNLERIRFGDQTCLGFFNQRVGIQPIQDAVTLCGRNKDVNDINLREMEKLPGESRRYLMRVEGDVSPSDKCVPDNLLLKCGARIIMTSNDPDGNWVNGTTGIVLSMHEDAILIHTDEGKDVWVLRHRWDVERYSVTEEGRKKRLSAVVEGSYEQFPMKPAWAMTIHKAQGHTFSSMNLYPNCFESGQLYTALSRVTSIEGLRLMNAIRNGDLLTHKSVIDFYSSIGWQSS